MKNKDLLNIFSLTNTKMIKLSQVEFDTNKVADLSHVNDYVGCSFESIIDINIDKSASMTLY